MELSPLFDSNKFEYTLKEARGIGWKFPPPEAITCIFCKKQIQIVGVRWPWENKICVWKEPECQCIRASEERKRKEEERKKAEEQKNIREKINKLSLQGKPGKRFLTRTFENFQVTERSRKAYEVSQKYANNFKKYEEQGVGLFFAGNYGTGKTHLAAAIRKVLLSKGVSVIFLTFIDLLQQLKRSWKLNNEEDILQGYYSCSLLIVDDLGKEKPSEWALDRLYAIVNHRYEEMKPIIITTNFPVEQLINRLTVGENGSTARALVSRLNEVCSGVCFDWSDWRGSK